MNTVELHDFKQRLDEGETIELHNNEDLAYLGKSKITKHYLFVFNTKPLFGYKTFRTFEKKAKDKIVQYRLTEVIE